MKFRWCFTVLLMLFASTPLVFAGNGTVGYAVHTAPLEIDGSLSNWPEGIEWVPIEQNYDNAPKSPADLSAKARFAYNLETNQFYVAVRVMDDDHRTGIGARWFEDDGAIVYLNTRHHVDGSGSAGFLASGSRREMVGLEGHYDPVAAGLDWSKAQAAVQRVGNTTTYEFQFALDEPSRPGSVLGVDIAVLDLDKEETSSDLSVLYWGPYYAKTRQSGRTADVILLDPAVELGTLKGAVSWGVMEPLEGQAPLARIASKTNPNMTVQVSGQSDFEIILPADDYEISYPFAVLGDLLGPHQRIEDNLYSTVTVLPNQTVIAPTLELRPKPKPDLYEDTGVLFDWQASDQPALDAFVGAWMDYFQLPGLSLAIVSGGEIAYHQVYGVSNAHTNQPVTKDTIFEAASITKIVFAFAVHRLAERGIIDLDRPLHNYLAFEELEDDPRYKLMTARHVLTHRTGLPNWRGGATSLAFTPGEKHQYSGEGFEYLKRIVAHITNKQIQQVLLDEVQKPMGFVDNTFFADEPALRKVVAHGHAIRRPNSAVISSRPGMAHSMHTEAKALANFMVSLLQKKGLKPETYQEMLTLASVAEPEPSEHDMPWPSGFGQGFALAQTPHGQAFWHGGNNGDFHARFEAYPDHNIGYVVMGNNERAWAMGEVLRRYLIAGSKVPSSLEATKED